MLNIFLIFVGKTLSIIAQTLNLGHGSTWPGHIALKLNKHFIHDLLSKSQVKTILIAGTNGKTTTSKLIKTALIESGKTIIQNHSGANLLNGVASTLLLNSNFSGKLNYDFAIFEVDENALSKLLKEVSPDYLLLINLFRDQLDRYGEVNTVANSWKQSLEKLTKSTTLILNADDPLVAYLGLAQKYYSSSEQSESRSSRQARTILYFGLQPSQFSKTKFQHAADSGYCPKCGKKLTFEAISFSHLGNWLCKKCGLKRPEIEESSFTVYPMPGLYNKYNVLAARLVLKQAGLTDENINDAFVDFEPAFGRQEIIKYKNRNVQVFLSKNPTSFNQSYTTICELEGPARNASPARSDAASSGEHSNAGGKTLLLVLNDRIPDGRDVSWIWDVDLPDLENFKHILVAGDRVYDTALRLKYELGSIKYEEIVKTYEDLKHAIDEGVRLVEDNQTLFILPTYSAMLETRKILTGKRIL